MDRSINAAARALAAGDPLGALRRVALRDDPPGLALRGIAMAQLGELQRAKELLRRAGRRFGDKEPLARARCLVAQSEVALALRELGPGRRLEAALETLEAHGDRHNATHARLVEARRRLLLGRISEAEQLRAAVELEGAPPMLRAIGELVLADIQLRRIQARAAAQTLRRALAAAAAARIESLQAEVERARAQLEKPAARLRQAEDLRLVSLGQVEALLESDALVIDACRRRVGACSLARRPVLFGLARALGEAWPHDVARGDLLSRVFEQARTSDSLRARLRVEIGRLRKALQGQAEIEATPRGFVLRPACDEVAVLLPPAEGDDAAVLALLADGAAWSTSSLAQALGVSQRTVQRALGELETRGRVRSIGQARARRWLTPAASGYTTALLLPAVPTSSE